ncbi:hypothetical protein [Vibrio sp. SCSIO 43136]|uniref:hypothetical protein n=1 Tax=Vibrio sp. SCSIO 43136 TaxID=2819101 RepID=UPI00207573FE|nr:hypothetical protein [Vibrio sp. SCSIO 43136]USD65707.1 hypothetical protein J4N39_02440 [Vibrio sp. SCSIO 43136]
MNKLTLIAASLLICATTAQAANTSPFHCAGTNKRNVLCEAYFDDSVSTKGAMVSVISPSGEVYVQGEVNKYFEFEFDRPKGDYQVILSGVEGKPEYRVEGADIYIPCNCKSKNKG